MFNIFQGSFDDTIHFEDVMPRNRRTLEYTEEVKPHHIIDFLIQII